MTGQPPSSRSTASGWVAMSVKSSPEFGGWQAHWAAAPPPPSGRCSGRGLLLAPELLELVAVARDDREQPLRRGLGHVLRRHGPQRRLPVRERHAREVARERVEHQVIDGVVVV